MKVYEVVTKYFDNGTVRVAFYTYELDRRPENRMVEQSRCDVYHDYFTDKQAACKHYADAKRMIITPWAFRPGRFLLLTVLQICCKLGKTIKNHMRLYA